MIIKGKRRKYGVFLTLMTMAVVAFAGFSGCDREKPVFLQKKVKVGVIYPQTGPDASTGEDIRAGIELAREIVNKSFNIPLPLAKESGLPSHGDAIIEIVYADSGSDPEKAFKAVEKLVKEDGVAAVMGDYRSNVTARASQQAEVIGIPFLNALSTSPLLTRQGFKWFFRTTPDDEIFVQNFFTFLSDLSSRRKMGIPRRLVLVYENKLFGTSVSQAEKQLAARYGYRVVGDFPYLSDAKQVDNEIIRIKQAMPAIILQTSYLNDALLFMREYKTRNINPDGLLAMNAGFISPAFLKSLGRDAEHVMSREVWALDLAGKKPLVRAVNDLFKERFKRDMEGNSARAFTGLIVLADAVNRAASLDAEDIRKSLLKTDMKGDQTIMPWDGVRFDPATGQNIQGKGIIVQVQDGVYHTVWPWALSERNVIWPMGSWSDKTR